MKSLWASSRIGIVYSLTSITAALLYVHFFGAMFGEWGWLHIAIALLAAGVLMIAAMGALDHQPNPYGRTHPMYDLKDVATRTSFGVGGFAWMTQLIPMILAIAAIVVIGRAFS